VGESTDSQAAALSAGGRRVLDSLIRSVESTFVQFSFRRLLYFIFIVTVFLVGLYVANELTGYTVYIRLSRRLELISRLRELETQGVRSSGNLSPLYDQALEALRTDQGPRLKPNLPVRGSVKFLSAALIPLIFMIASLPGLMKGDSEASSQFAGATVVGLLFGIAGLFAPTSRSLLATAITLFGAQLVVLGMLMVIYRRQRAKV